MDATPPDVAPGAHAPLRDTKGLSEHVVYEINRFFETHDMLVRGEVESGTVLHDAVLEFFALHLRNLVEFFFDKVKWPDNARAEHFFSDPAVWHELRGGDNYLTAAQTQDTSRSPTLPTTASARTSAGRRRPRGEGAQSGAHVPRQRRGGAHGARAHRAEEDVPQVEWPRARRGRSRLACFNPCSAASWLLSSSVRP